MPPPEGPFWEHAKTSGHALAARRRIIERKAQVNDKVDQVLSLVLMIVGLVVILVCMTADLTGIGATPEYIGWRQYSGTVIGVVMVFFGAHIAYHHVLRK